MYLNASMWASAEFAAPDVSAPPDWGALHRVLTDDLRIVCPDGGSFEYRIELP